MKNLFLMILVVFWLISMGCGSQSADYADTPDDNQEWKNVAYTESHSEVALLSDLSKDLKSASIESYIMTGRAAVLRVPAQDIEKAVELVVELIKVPRYVGKVHMFNE